MSEGMLAPPKLPMPSGAFDALMRDMLDRMHEMAQDARATMGTITSISGGNIVVHIDGERISRSVGFARKKGTAYLVGDRVLLEPTRSDEYVVAGVIGNDAADNRVGSSQIAAFAVGLDEITNELYEYITSQRVDAYTKVDADARFLTLAEGQANFAGLNNYTIVRTELRSRLCALERTAYGSTSGACS